MVPPEQTADSGHLKSWGWRAEGARALQTRSVVAGGVPGSCRPCEGTVLKLSEAEALWAAVSSLIRVCTLQERVSVTGARRKLSALPRYCLVDGRACQGACQKEGSASCVLGAGFAGAPGDGHGDGLVLASPVSGGPGISKLRALVLGWSLKYTLRARM